MKELCSVLVSAVLSCVLFAAANLTHPAQQTDGDIDNGDAAQAWRDLIIANHNFFAASPLI